MDLFSMFFLAVGLAMDSFSVSITRGMILKCNLKYAFIIALFFGVFQALMPVAGWLAGEQLAVLVKLWAPWIAFILLLIIGGKMVYEGLSHAEEDEICQIFSIKDILILSIATSIDAFAVGVSFAFLNTPILLPILIIGLVTFALSFIGVYIGKRVGHLFEGKIEVLGGVILIGIGLKILLENLV
ncbi:manganese efflux pump MntP [Methanobacterium ferruginis]|uniref:manganese efflux pump MntP n=1 Tax=Methanobacterium ferruginis TaxID=710191 RepID=UPI0025729BF9|nr:manganese efflux pump MntP family protein [Methanobacterium ferruginis]